MNINLSYSSGCYCFWSGCNVPLLSIIWGRNITKIIYIVIHWTLKNYDNPTRHNFHTFLWEAVQEGTISWLQKKTISTNFALKNSTGLKNWEPPLQLMLHMETYNNSGDFFLMFQHSKWAFQRDFPFSRWIFVCFNSFLIVFISTEKDSQGSNTPLFLAEHQSTKVTSCFLSCFLHLRICKKP